ncbi:evC complex member EVC isoform X2 [Genypterus blacodes]|uniref:evC complex member EVC isoform X2 n=1 Tax=Genypterus blacodes TaxID=154954 RepID=UPI003F75BA28
MSKQEHMAGCGTDVSVSFAESLHIYSGLLTVATVSGGLAGILAAALLYSFCFKPLLLTRQGYNARRLFEPDDGELEHNQSDRVSSSKKEPPSGTNHEKEKQLPPMNSDVAAFASRAKVVYPINQKYRPLADGASNPSLHEHPKLPAAPNDESSSSTSGESLSQDRDNDGSSQFISSSLVPKSLQNQSFTRVSHYPHSVTQNGFEGRMSLYCLALQDVQEQCCQLQEEKCLLFLHTVKMIVSRRFPKDKSEADFSKNVLQKQEKDLNELKKRLSADQTSSKKMGGASCTVEEMERAQKDLLEHGLQMSKGFSRQVEELCQQLLSKSSFIPAEEVQDVIGSVIQTLLSVEKHLIHIQEADLKRTQHRLLWWEEVMGLLHSQPALLRWEVTLRQSLVATTLEQLTSDDLLTFSQMEKMLSDVQASLSEALQQCTEECTRKMKELVSEKCRKADGKQTKLQRSQAKEKSRALDGTQTHSSEPLQLTKEYQELLVKHRQQIADLEQQQDNRVAEALCDLWKKLRSSWSKRLGALVREAFMASVPAQSELSAERCDKLWVEVEQQLASQLQQVESTIRLQLEDSRAQLHRDQQVWCEETALLQACIKHLSQQQMKILRAMLVRQSYSLNSPAEKLMEEKHQHLLAAVQRYFVVRHFSLHALKEMRLSKLKALSQSDFRALLMEEQSKSLTFVNTEQHKSSSASLAERHLGPETQLVSHSFQQEFLSELETGAELLQNHAQLLLGNALSHAIRHTMEAPAPTPKQEAGLKRHLTEAASESVYVTKDSLTALVQSFYSRLHDITETLQQDQAHTSREEEERREGSSQLNKALLRELLNWGRKPTSAEFQQRVELHKRKVLEQSDVEQEAISEALRKRKEAQDRFMDRVKGQLWEAEEDFITELAALARVPLHRAEPEPEPSDQDDVTGEDVSSTILNLLALNPALDPALNPSLTPSVVTPAVKPTKQKKREQESLLH